MTDWLKRFRTLSREEYAGNKTDKTDETSSEEGFVGSVGFVTGISTPKRLPAQVESPDQLTRARKASRHPLPPGAPVCARCQLLLCGEGIRRGNSLYHPMCLGDRP
jgi:hypothetical protein